MTFKMNKLVYLTIPLLIWSCQPGKEKSADSSNDKVVVAAVNYPMYFFTKAIGGDLVQVYLPALGGDPAYWKPDARMVSNYQKADLIVANGAGYAKWMEKVSLPSSKIVNTSLSFKAQWIETEEGITHSHGPEGEHVHKGTAFTTWLNLSFASQQAQSIYEALLVAMPGMEDQLKSNFNKLKEELATLDAKLNELAKMINGQQLIGSHPVYQYLSSGYGLNINSLHWEPDEMPGDEEWKSLQSLMQSSGAQIMLWEDEPTQQIKTKLDEIGMHYSVFNPCGNKPESADFLDVMRKNSVDLENILLQKTAN